MSHRGSIAAISSTNEGGTIPEENLVGYTRDRTETFAQVWLGLTANCAVCHDHKFDPMTQREFYELSAFFNNSTVGEKDGNIKDTPPTAFVPADRDRDRWEVLAGKLAEARSAVERRKDEGRPAFDSWMAKVTPGEVAALAPGEGLGLLARLGDGVWASRPGPPLEVADGGDFEADQGFSFGAWIKLPKAG